MHYIVDKAKVSDIDDICNLIYSRCLWFLEKGILGWELGYYDIKYNKDYFVEQMNINNLFVAKLDNKVVGAMLLKDSDRNYWDNDDESFYIHHLVTDINLKGVGKELIDFAIRNCILNNKKYLRLDCFKDNRFLNDYYKSIGFRNVGSGSEVDYDYNLWEVNIDEYFGFNKIKKKY